MVPTAKAEKRFTWQPRKKRVRRLKKIVTFVRLLLWHEFFALNWHTIPNFVALGECINSFSGTRPCITILATCHCEASSQERGRYIGIKGFRRINGCPPIYSSTLNLASAHSPSADNSWTPLQTFITATMIQNGHVNSVAGYDSLQPFGGRTWVTTLQRITALA